MFSSSNLPNQSNPCNQGNLFSTDFKENSYPPNIQNQNNNNNNLFTNNTNNQQGNLFQQQDRPVLQSANNNTFTSGPYSPQVQFIEFDNLPKFPSHMNVQQITDQIQMNFKSDDWKLKFSSIDCLRVINKFYQNDSNQVFQMFWNDIMASLDSKKTCIEKNVVYLFREAFGIKRTTNFHDKILNDVLPKLVVKTVHADKTFIKSLCWETLTHLVTNYVNDSVIENLAMSLIRYEKAKNFAVADKSLDLLAMIIQHLGQHLGQVSNRSLQCIFYVLSEC